MQFLLLIWVYKAREDEIKSILTCHGSIHDHGRDCSRLRRGHCTSPPLTPAKSPHRAFSSGEFVPRSFAFAHWPFNFQLKRKKSFFLYLYFILQLTFILIRFIVFSLYFKKKTTKKKEKKRKEVKVIVLFSS